MNLKNYKISDSQIELIALLLIEKNGSTTNLDIKNQFRSTGFYVTQNDIASAMSRMENSGKFTSSNNGSYRTFRIGKISGISTQVVSKATKSVTVNFSQSAGRGNRKNPATAPTQALVSPLRGNFNSTAIIKDTSDVYKDAWMVSEAGTSNVLYMHKTISRSQAISKYAKETGTRYDDIRCRRVK